MSQQSKSTLTLKPAKRNGVSIFYGDTPLSSIYDPIKEGNRLWEDKYASNIDVYLKQQSVIPPTIVFLGAPPYYPMLRALQVVDKVWIIDDNCHHTQGLEVILAKIAKHTNTSIKLQDKQLIIHQNVQPLASSWSQIEKQAIENLLKSLFFIESRYVASSWLQHNKHMLVNALKEKLQVYSTNAYFNWIWHINAVKHLLRTTKQSKPTIQWLAACMPMLRAKKHIHKHRKKALLIASGSSVEDNVDEIKERSATSWVFSLPAMYSLLRRHQVKVDALIATDGGYYNLLHFDKIADPHLPILAPLSLYEGIGKRFINVFYFIDLIEHWNILRSLQLENSNFIPMQGTVISSAYVCLHRLGFTDIALFGVDFTATPFKLHARGNTTEEIYFNAHTKLVPYETLISLLSNVQKASNGDYTDNKLALYACLFDEARTICLNDNSLVFDDKPLANDSLPVSYSLVKDFHAHLLKIMNEQEGATNPRDVYLKRRFVQLIKDEQK